MLHYVKTAYEDLERQKQEQWREWAIMDTANQPHWQGATPGAPAHERARRQIVGERTRREAAKYRPGWMWSWETAAAEQPEPAPRDPEADDDEFRRTLVAKALQLWQSEEEARRRDAARVF